MAPFPVIALNGAMSVTTGSVPHAHASIKRVAAPFARAADHEQIGGAVPVGASRACGIAPTSRTRSASSGDWRYAAAPPAAVPRRHTPSSALHRASSPAPVRSRPARSADPCWRRDGPTHSTAGSPAMPVTLRACGAIDRAHVRAGLEHFVDIVLAPDEPALDPRRRLRPAREQVARRPPASRDDEPRQRARNGATARRHDPARQAPSMRAAPAASSAVTDRRVDAVDVNDVRFARHHRRMKPARRERAQAGRFDRTGSRRRRGERPRRDRTPARPAPTAPHPPPRHSSRSACDTSRAAPPGSRCRGSNA